MKEIYDCSFLQNETTNGGTNYFDAFLKIENILHKSSKNEEILILFLTDGDDGMGNKEELYSKLS